MSEYLTSVLAELVPRFDHERGDWDGVLADSGDRARSDRRPRRRLTRRRLALVAFLLAAAVLPVVGAASQGWWFLEFDDAMSQRIGDVHVVQTGSWDGRPWELAAYLSRDGVCFSLTPMSPSSRAGEGAALACAWIRGVPDSVPRPPEWRRLTVTLLAGSSRDFPAYVVGPVVERADEVAIHFADGTVLRTPTFDVPGELGAIRFYAVQRPEPAHVAGLPPQPSIRRVAGLTREGEVVACLVVMGPIQGGLADCS